MKESGDVDIFFYEAFSEEEEALKRHMPPFICAGYTALTIQETIQRKPPAPLISIRTQSVIPPAWSDELEGILTRSTGFDHIKLFHETSMTIVPAGYLPHYCSRSVAEQALLLWLSLLRKLPRQIGQFRNFNRDGLTGGESKGRTLLVVGVGNIGSEICRIGSALGMKVLGVDIVRKYPDIDYVSIEEGLCQADVVACAMDLTPINRGYFHYDLLKNAKPGAVFVNIARGELSPPADLLRLLDEHHLSGVGLDVYDKESALAVGLRTGEPNNDPAVQACIELSKRNDAVLTPHNAFNTAEALERKAEQSAAQTVRFVSEKRFIWQVPS